MKMMKKLLACVMACAMLVGTVTVYGQTAYQTDLDLDSIAAAADSDVLDDEIIEVLISSKVQTFDVYDNNYEEVEPNDTTAEADFIKDDYTIIGTYSYADVDIYKVNLGERSYVNVVLAALTPDFSCSLYSADKTALLNASPMDVEGGLEGVYYYSLTMELPAGNYYFGLTDLNITTGTYDYEMYYWTETINTDPSPFLDVQYSDPYAFYYDAVLWAYENDITTGTSALLFSPDQGCTRAQVVTFLWRCAGSPEATISNHAFTDVEKGSYYYDAVLWAVENGVTTGASVSKFSPDETCTRAQFVTFLWRCMGKQQPDSYVTAFTDLEEGAYYLDAVMWAVGKGITTGTSETAFSPEAMCTRGQVVTFLHRTSKIPPTIL